jgi:beta-lactamase class A
VDANGQLQTVVDDTADTVTNGYSVQKFAVATAVMDKVDRGLLSLGQKLDLPALELNEILAAKGFVYTRVIPVANPDRFFLGVTTPREMHDLLWRLANKTLLSPGSCEFLLRILRWMNGYHDGIRRNMSSNERSRVATKHGADFNSMGATRNEAGIMFGANGAPQLTYAFFANGLGELDNYGATHPAVEAHAKLGRVMFDALPGPRDDDDVAKTVVPEFVPNNGG